MLLPIVTVALAGGALAATARAARHAATAIRPVLALARGKMVPSVPILSASHGAVNVGTEI
jgi:hypothetical protein